MRYFLLLLVILVLLTSTNVQAALRTEVIEYKHGDILLEGYLAYDDGVKGKRPGVMVVHDGLLRRDV